MNGVIAGGLVLRRGITQHELGAQFLGDLGIDIVHRLFLLGLEESSPGLLGDFLEDVVSSRCALNNPFSFWSLAPFASLGRATIN